MSGDIKPQPRPMGIDPAFRRTGWAVLAHDRGQPALLASGSIVPRGNSRGEGLLSIQSQLQAVVQAWCPTSVIFEQPGKWMRRVGSSRESVEVMAMARGVMLATCAEMRVPAFEVDFQVVRLALLGQQNASKASAAELVSHLGLGLPRRPRGGVDLDVVDAIMMALFGLDGGLSMDEEVGRRTQGKSRLEVSVQLPLS